MKWAWWKNRRKRRQAEEKSRKRNPSGWKKDPALALAAAASQEPLNAVLAGTDEEGS
ncbi:hypothetical protein GCM10010977_16960 [Citricoccus zhacaiensis]|uniref:Uncharacterized protein n=1 Tax=Citricoccus zhacaiensis TaxID=489142 RepID=A0ABQ2LZB1_9MICC|nr:hypothetical protein GCM10010977_16960 [Citricoccus zhacaiensis]